MAVLSFAAPFTLSAALLAGWLDWRLGKRRPVSLMYCMGHAAAAFAVLQLATAGSGYVAGASAAAERRLTVVFVLLLPSLVYCFLATIWLMRTLAEVARLARH